MSEKSNKGCFAFDITAFNQLSWSMKEKEFSLVETEAPSRYTKNLGLGMWAELYTHEGIWTVTVCRGGGMGYSCIGYYKIGGLTIGQADRAKLLADIFIERFFLQGGDEKCMGFVKVADSTNY